jgi:hypothetical protein
MQTLLLYFCLQALQMVLAARPTVQPDWGFMEQLLAFQERQWRLPSSVGDGMRAEECTVVAQPAPPAACAVPTMQAMATPSDLLPV